MIIWLDFLHIHIEDRNCNLHVKWMEHQGSTDAKGLWLGDVQWMKTEEVLSLNELSGEIIEFSTLDNMPAKLKKNKPEYIYIKGKELGVHSDKEKTIKVIAGKYLKLEGAEKNHNVNSIYFHVILKEDKEFKYEVPLGHNSFVYILKGDLKIGEKNHGKAGDSSLILLERGSELKIRAEKETEFLFIAGKPIGEPIARGGPFVMNTKAEILEAIQDYNNGTFAKY